MGILNRITSFRSVFADSEEAIFADLKKITRNTSSNRPAEIAKNAIVRFNEIKKDTHVRSDKSRIGKLSDEIDVESLYSDNSVLPWSAPGLIEHIRNNADYFSLPEYTWYEFTDAGILCYDAHRPQHSVDISVRTIFSYSKLLYGTLI